MERNEPIPLLGLALRGGRLAVGEDAVRDTVQAGQARLLMVSADASERTVRLASHLSQTGNCLLLSLPCSKEELGSGLGRGPVAVTALTDGGLAAAVGRRLAALDPETYGDVAARLDLKLRRAKERRKKREEAPPQDRRPVKKSGGSGGNRRTETSRRTENDRRTEGYREGKQAESHRGTGDRRGRRRTEDLRGRKRTENSKAHQQVGRRKERGETENPVPRKYMGERRAGNSLSRRREYGKPQQKGKNLTRSRSAVFHKGEREGGRKHQFP